MISFNFRGTFSEYNRPTGLNLSGAYLAEATTGPPPQELTIFFKRLAPIRALFSQMNRTYNTLYVNQFLPPLGFEPRFLGNISR